MQVTVERSVHMLGQLRPGASLLEVDTSHIEEAIAERVGAGWRVTATATVPVGGDCYELALWWAKGEE